MTLPNLNVTVFILNKVFEGSPYVKYALPGTVAIVMIYNILDFFKRFAQLPLRTAIGSAFTKITSYMPLLNKGERSSSPPSMQELAIAEVHQLTKEIAVRKKMKERFDQFFLVNHELKQVALAALQNYKLVYANYIPPVLDDHDPSDPIRQRTLLALEKIDLDCDLHERMLFVQRHPDVYECMKRHLAFSTIPSYSVS